MASGLLWRRAGRVTRSRSSSGLPRGYAAGLARLGIEPGARVATLAGSSAELVIATLGHYHAGVIHVPINTRYRAAEIGHILDDAGPTALIVDAAGGAGAELARQRGIRLIDSHGASANSVATLAETPPVPSQLADDESIAMLIYTSGTTGRSKGVALSFRALISNMDALTSHWGVSTADRLLLALPLFHVHGLAIGIHGGLLRGATILLEPRFDAALVIDAFAHRDATMFMGVPTMYTLLLEHLGGASARC